MHSVLRFYIRKWFFFLILLLVSLSACNASVQENNSAEMQLCQDPRPEICTMEYVPVCATLESGEQKTYASGCSACADTKVIGYRPDECEESMK